MEFPYGIYDVLRTSGTVYIGSSADTPEFAVAALARWWEEEGCVAYPDAKQVLILADTGTPAKPADVLPQS